MSTLNTKEKMKLIFNIIEVYKPHILAIKDTRAIPQESFNEAMKLLSYVYSFVGMDKEEYLSALKSITEDGDESMEDNIQLLWALYQIM